MRGRHIFLACTVLLASLHGVAAQQMVRFPSADGRTQLFGFLFLPSSRGTHPAVILLHGRAGVYSSLAHGIHDASTLSKRHKFWGEYWANHGYIALLVDSFGPRGFWEGFPKHSYSDRPSEVSEQTERPLDAYGALAYLRSRRDVRTDRIALQGWSNGAMTTLATMSSKAPGISRPTVASGFRAALAFYPGCGMEAIQGAYRPYAPILMFVGLADDEVSPQRCQKWAEKARNAGAPIEIIAYPGAGHNFDDPSRSKQSDPSNASATADAIRRAERFFHEQLR